MKVCGIIAEFNPLHKGHHFLIQKAREQFQADYIIVIMSGDHVQRGEPAIADKYLRTQAALQSGADLVLELPVCFATGSAQYFSRGAVAALLATGVIDFLLFGSESGDLSMLHSFSAVDVSLRTGEQLLPNNQLGIEYLRAYEYLDPTSQKGVSFQTIARIGSGHHDQSICNGYCSATYLRSLLQNNDITQINNVVPQFYLETLYDYYSSHHKMTLNSYQSSLYYALLVNKVNGYNDFFDVYPDLSDKIAKQLSDYTNPIDYCTLLKSKDITLTHIRRALLHILLGIRTSLVEILISKYSYCAYLRILGMNTLASPLLHAVKSNASCPLLSKLADARKSLAEDSLALLQQDIFASELYQYTSSISKKACIHNEYRQNIVTIQRCD